MAGFSIVTQPTVTSGAYSAGDIMGGLLTFTTGMKANRPLIINEVTVMFKSAVTPSLNFVLLTDSPTSTTTTDNAAYSLNTADAFKVRKTIAVSTFYDHGTPNEYSTGAINLIMRPGLDSSNVYGLLIDGTGVTLTSTSDVQVRITGLECEA